MISVVIPTYNRANLIVRAINSVLNQSYSDLEVIVVDDASSDNTKEIVESIPCDCLRYIRLKTNSGACHARNVGIDEAQGDYIAFLDSDDEWHRDKLKIQMEYLTRKKASAIACNYLYNKNGNEQKAIMDNIGEYFELSVLLNRNYITTGAILVKKDLLLSIGKFDEKMPRYQDWDLVIRLAKETSILYCNEILLTLFFQTESITNSTSKAKKYYALTRMYEKYEGDYKNNLQADAHINWSMGMYSLYLDAPRYDCLKKGIYIGTLNFKRLFIYMAIRLGLRNKIKDIYGKRH